MKVSIM